MKTGTPQTSLNFKACGSSPATHPHKELVTPYLHPQGSKWHWSPPSRVPRKLLSQEAEELATLICCGTHSTTSRRAQEPWRELVTYCPATKQNKVTTQHRPGSLGLVIKEMDNTPPPIPTAQGLQQRSWACTEWSGARGHDEDCRRPEDRTHRAGQVVSTTRPPGGSMDGQWIKVCSKMTLRPRAATPVNRSRSLVQVRPPSQFSDLEPRNRDRAGPWGEDAAAPQHTIKGKTPALPKGTSGSWSVTPCKEVGPSEGWMLPDTGST